MSRHRRLLISAQTCHMLTLTRKPGAPVRRVAHSNCACGALSRHVCSDCRASYLCADSIANRRVAPRHRPRALFLAAILGTRGTADQRRVCASCDSLSSSVRATVGGAPIICMRSILLAGSGQLCYSVCGGGVFRPCAGFRPLVGGRDDRVKSSPCIRLYDRSPTGAD